MSNGSHKFANSTAERNLIEDPGYILNTSMNYANYIKEIGPIVHRNTVSNGHGEKQLALRLLKQITNSANKAIDVLQMDPAEVYERHSSIGWGGFATIFLMRRKSDQK